MKPITLFLIAFLALSCQSNAQQQDAFQNINTEEFAAMMEGEDIVILDVRTPKETAQGKIAGAKEINVLEDDFAQKIMELDTSKTYLVYCRSGRRSVNACNIMAEQGFEKLYNMLGGYNEWKRVKEIE